MGSAGKGEREKQTQTQTQTPIDGYISAAEYLRHRYEISAELPERPLSDESFAATWREASGGAVLDFLADEFGLPAFRFPWEDGKALKISFAETLGGRLPSVATASHKDFRQGRRRWSCRRR